MLALHLPTRSDAQSGWPVPPHMSPPVEKCGLPWIVHLPAAIVNVMKNSAAAPLPTMSPSGVGDDSTSTTYSPSAYPGFVASPMSLASLRAKLAPPVGARPALAGNGFADSVPAGLASLALFPCPPDVLMMLSDALPAPFSTAAPAAPAIASAVAVPTAIMILLLRMNCPPRVWCGLMKQTTVRLHSGLVSSTSTKKVADAMRYDPDLKRSSRCAIADDGARPSTRT